MKDVKPLTKQHEKLLLLLDEVVHGLEVRGMSEAAITLYPSQWTLIESILSGKHRAPIGFDVKTRTYKGHLLRRMET